MEDKEMFDSFQSLGAMIEKVLALMHKEGGGIRR